MIPKRAVYEPWVYRLCIALLKTILLGPLWYVNGQFLNCHYVGYALHDRERAVHEPWVYRLCNPSLKVIFLEPLWYTNGRFLNHGYIGYVLHCSKEFY
jgi:hypothetical protein